MAVIRNANNEQVVEGVADIHIQHYGLFATHNMPCPIFTEDKHAVLDINTGVFHPSVEAQIRGWTTIKIRPERRWLYNLLSPLFTSRSRS